MAGWRRLYRRDRGERRRRNRSSRPHNPRVTSLWPQRRSCARRRWRRTRRSAWSSTRSSPCRRIPSQGRSAGSRVRSCSPTSRSPQFQEALVSFEPSKGASRTFPDPPRPTPIGDRRRRPAVDPVFARFGLLRDQLGVAAEGTAPAHHSGPRRPRRCGRTRSAGQHRLNLGSIVVQRLHPLDQPVHAPGETSRFPPVIHGVHRLRTGLMKLKQAPPRSAPAPLGVFRETPCSHSPTPGTRAQSR